jgi:tetratricopeptide (TPR) repeat protein
MFAISNGARPLQDVLMKTRISILTLLLLLITACTTPPAQDNTLEPAPETKPSAEKIPPKAPPRTVVKDATQPPPATSPELSGELLYYLLSAEIAGQRGRLDVAVPFYLKAAQLSRDPAIVERATRVAVYARDEKSALAAAQMWVELQPDNLEAHQVTAALLMREGKVDEALPHLERVLRVDQQNSHNSYMLITSLLSKEKDKQAALEAMEKLLAKRRHDPEALYAYAHLAMLVGSLDKAETAINEVIELIPNWSEAHILRANILIRQGQNERVLSLMQETLESYPDDVMIRLFYARRLVDERRYEQAREQFSQLLDYKPDASEALFAMGLLNLRTQRPADAQRNFERLVELGQRVNEAHYYLGQAAEMQGDTEAAMQYYTEVREGSNYIDAQIRIAALLAEQGDIDAARAHVQNISAPTLDVELRLFLAEGEILRNANQFEDAYEVYSLALQQMPDNSQLLYSRALTAEKLGRIDEAIADLELIVKNEPNNAEALNALGYTLVDLTHRIAEGKQYIEKALKLKPDDPAILDSMGWAYYRLGQHEKALQYLQQAFDKLKDPEIAAHLGEVLWVLGNKERARQIWDEALRETPKDKVLLNVIERFDQ